MPDSTIILIACLRRDSGFSLHPSECTRIRCVALSMDQILYTIKAIDDISISLGLAYIELTSRNNIECESERDQGIDKWFEMNCVQQSSFVQSSLDINSNRSAS